MHVSRVAQRVDLHVPVGQTFHAAEFTPAAQSVDSQPGLTPSRASAASTVLDSKHGDGHGPYTAGNGRNPGRALRRGARIPRRQRVCRRKPVDSHVDDDGAITNPLPGM